MWKGFNGNAVWESEGFHAGFHAGFNGVLKCLFVFCSRVFIGYRKLQEGFGRILVGLNERWGVGRVVMAFRMALKGVRGVWTGILFDLNALENARFRRCNPELQPGHRL